MRTPSLDTHVLRLYAFYIISFYTTHSCCISLFISYISILDWLVTRVKFPWPKDPSWADLGWSPLHQASERLIWIWRPSKLILSPIQNSWKARNYVVPSGTQTWEWEIPNKWRFLAGKIMYKWRILHCPCLITKYYQRVNMVGIYRVTTDMIHMGLEIRVFFCFCCFQTTLKSGTAPPSGN